MEAHAAPHGFWRHFIRHECKGSISHFYVKRIFGPNGSEGHRIWIFQNINPKISLISLKWYFGDIIETFGFLSEKFKFCDLLKHLEKKTFYVKMWDRTFAFSAHEFYPCFLSTCSTRMWMQVGRLSTILRAGYYNEGWIVTTEECLFRYFKTLFFEHELLFNCGHFSKMGSIIINVPGGRVICQSRHKSTEQT